MICKVDGCDSESCKKGYCNRHYLQQYRHGKILPIKRNKYDPQEFELMRNTCRINLYDKNGEYCGRAIIDKEDYELVKDYKFYFWAKRYVKVSSPKMKKHLFLHQLIMGREWVDHIDGNPLNNRRSNLRLCNNQQNQFNQKPQKGRFSEYKGVYKNVSGRTKPYRAYVRFNGKDIYLGVFASEKEAALAYDEAALKYFGEFARLNFP